MANTTTNSDLRVKKFLSDFFEEYIRKSRFARYTGEGNNNVICIKEGLQQIVIPLVTRLLGAGVSGSTTLRGNGEAISNYGLTLTPTYYRHAVEHDLEELEKPAIDLMEASRGLLMEWAKELQRDQIINALGAIYNGTTYANYSTATGANMDTWNTNNSDRILYGAAKSNLSSGNHTTSLGNIDTTNDKMTAAMTTLAKRMAQQASPHIRPIKTSEDEEMFIMFHDPYAFRNLKTDSVMAQAEREALVRGEDNPIFAGGDLLYDGVIHREIPEIAVMIDGSSGTNGVWGGAIAGSGGDSLSTSGASTTRVGVSFLCGQQAVSYGLGRRPEIKVDKTYDYGFQPGVAVQLKQDIRKSFFNNKQHGCVTVFSSAAVDA